MSQAPKKREANNIPSEKVLKLIKEVEKNQYIWKSSLKDYQNNEKRKEFFRLMSLKLKCKAEKLEKKWNYFKDRYPQVHALFKEKLNFLKSRNCVRLTLDNIQDIAEEQNAIGSEKENTTNDNVNEILDYQEESNMQSTSTNVHFQREIFYNSNPPSQPTSQESLTITHKTAKNNKKVTFSQVNSQIKINEAAQKSITSAADRFLKLNSLYQLSGHPNINQTTTAEQMSPNLHYFQSIANFSKSVGLIGSIELKRRIGEIISTFIIEENIYCNSAVSGQESDWQLYAKLFDLLSPLEVLQLRIKIDQFLLEFSGIHNVEFAVRPDGSSAKASKQPLSTTIVEQPFDFDLLE